MSNYSNCIWGLHLKQLKLVFFFFFQILDRRQWNPAGFWLFLPPSVGILNFEFEIWIMRREWDEEWAYHLVGLLVVDLHSTYMIDLRQLLFYPKKKSNYFLAYIHFNYQSHFSLSLFLVMNTISFYLLYYYYFIYSLYFLNFFFSISCVQLSFNKRKKISGFFFFFWVIKIIFFYWSSRY